MIYTFFVSPSGDDDWSGRCPTRPFATLRRAQQAVRRFKEKGRLPGAVRVLLRGGIYQLDKPLVFTAADSGLPPHGAGGERGVTYAAYPGETPVISGGRLISGWRETSLRGRRAWVAACRGQFTQLWVNGRRAPRPRWPGQGYLRVEALPGSRGGKGGSLPLFTGQHRFRFARGDLHDWRNVRDVEFVARHFWIESRIPFRRIDPRACEAHLQFKTRMRLTDDVSDQGAPYYVENIFEELHQPGHWYHDRGRGELYYLPLPGERIEKAAVIVPYLPLLLTVRGAAYLTFDGLTFSHSEWVPDAELTCVPQAACDIPGALAFEQAHDCAVRNCRLEHLGSYAVAIGVGSLDIAITDNWITDLAAGGVKIWHAPEAGAEPCQTAGRSGVRSPTAGAARRILVADNEIADGGHRWSAGVGVLVGRCSGNRILRNHIHDFNYTGVSVGWTWGYGEGDAYGNVIEHNHIHHIGRGVLSDMGAIYLLGVAPGTRVRYNLIHDVDSRGYGGWGVYLDEGSSHVLVENNVVYRTKSGSLHQHYGRENIIHNNIFALGGDGLIQLSRREAHSPFEVTHNIFLSDRANILAANVWGGLKGLADMGVIDNNLYWVRSAGGPRFATRSFKQWLTFGKWQTFGFDQGSKVANPRFVNPSRGDFRLRPGSPALKIGFTPFPPQAGPRQGGRTGKKRCLTRDIPG